MSSAASTAATSKPPSASPQANLEEVELCHIQDGSAEARLPLEEDIMQCARLGALEHIQSMYAKGKYGAKYQDGEGITPLHWAAINNQYAVCKWFIEQGVDVNIRGGESGATAAMWAAQRCHYYIVNLLIQSGADLTLADGQGYNILHLATIDGNALLLILLLHQEIPVDVPDPQGHTSLMWAGYKGWPACVDLLLRWGASVNARDGNGYTPLHWALVKGSKPCLEKLIEFDANRFAETNEGKTPAVCADEMNTMRQYRRALSDQGYQPDGNPQALPLGLQTLLRNRSRIGKIFFFYPFFILFAVIFLISHFPIYIGLPTSFAMSFGLQWIAQQVANRCPPDYHSLHKTPFLAGVFAGTLFWVGTTYLYIILPTTFSSQILFNVLFTLAFASTTYFYFTALLEDPGYIPKLASRSQQRLIVEELFSLWRFDEDNYCVQCMIRKPLRSKHCRRCGRCVAKHDHHCPWINNCVGNNNIRHFFIYIISLEFGIILFIRLVLAYLERLPEPTDATCNVLPPALCSLVLRDSWTVTISIWACLQLIWVTMLLVVQSVQISKNTTTFENMKRHSPNGSHADHYPGPPQTHPQAFLHLPASAAGSLNDSAAAASRLRPAPHRPDGCLTRWGKLLGLDAFMATATDLPSDGLRSRGNPFSRGFIGNCRDFWSDPAPLFGQRNNGEGYLGGEVVDYAHMYETPLRSRRRRAEGMEYRSVADGRTIEADEVV